MRFRIVGTAVIKVHPLGTMSKLANAEIAQSISRASEKLHSAHADQETAQHKIRFVAEQITESRIPVKSWLNLSESERLLWVDDSAISAANLPHRLVGRRAQISNPSESASIISVTR
jgi:hypothetical protein